ncbi:hypothetical protein K501DRAFT_151413, partial [Backusella circina FSU 941]
LPLEIINQIFDHLSSNDLCTITRLNSTWHIFGSQRLYKHPKIGTLDQFKKFIIINQELQSYIHELDLTEVSHYVTDTSLASLVHLSHLRCVNLSNCMQLSPNTIHQVIHKSLPTLHKLLLANCKLSTDILSLVGRASHLHLMTLDLSNTMISPCIAIDSAHHLDSMLTGPIDSSEIVYLDLSFCSWVERQTVMNIARALPKLKHIVLQWCNKLKLETMLDLTRHLTYLETVDIRNIHGI